MTDVKPRWTRYRKVYAFTMDEATRTRLEAFVNKYADRTTLSSVVEDAVNAYLDTNPKPPKPKDAK